MTSKVFGLLLGCLWVTAAIASGPGDTWYVQADLGHFDYYWPGRGDGDRPPDASPGSGPQSGYQGGSHPYSMDQGWERAPSYRQGAAAPRWGSADAGSGPAGAEYDDWRAQDGRWLPNDGGVSRPSSSSRVGSYGRDNSSRSVYPSPSAGSGESGYRFREPEGAPYSGGAPTFDAADDSEPPESAYPRYRFRGDPEPGEGGWRIDSGGAAFRFRPLSEQELERIQSNSGYRPLGGTQGASFYRPQGLGDGWRPGAEPRGRSSGPWVER